MIKRERIPSLQETSSSRLYRGEYLIGIRLFMIISYYYSLTFLLLQSFILSISPPPSPPLLILLPPAALAALAAAPAAAAVVAAPAAAVVAVPAAAPQRSWVGRDHGSKSKDIVSDIKDVFRSVTCDFSET